MTRLAPSAYHPQLTNSCLSTVAEWLLEELYATEDNLSRSTDCGYTVGCATFGRQKNRIRIEASTGQHHWLGLLNNGNDLVFTIGGIPCRFSNDDPSNPTKDAVLVANRYQINFQEFATNDEPARFCFVIDSGFQGSSEARVEFFGFGSDGQVMCHWSSDVARVLRLEGATPHQAVPVQKPLVSPKRRDGDSSVADVQK